MKSRVKIGTRHTVQIRRHTSRIESLRRHSQRSTKVNHAGDGAAVDDLQTVGVLLADIELEVDLALVGSSDSELKSLVM